MAIACGWSMNLGIETGIVEVPLLCLSPPGGEEGNHHIVHQYLFYLDFLPAGVIGIFLHT